MTHAPCHDIILIVLEAEYVVTTTQRVSHEVESEFVGHWVELS